MKKLIVILVLLNGCYNSYLKFSPNNLSNAHYNQKYEQKISIYNGPVFSLNTKITPKNSGLEFIYSQNGFLNEIKVSGTIKTQKPILIEICATTSGTNIDSGQEGCHKYTINVD